MPILAYVALAGLGWWLWDSGSLSDLFGPPSPCQLDPHMPPVLQDQLFQMMDGFPDAAGGKRQPTRAELDAFAASLAQLGFPASAACVSAKPGSDE